jgi:beta-lactamase class A
MTRLAPTRRQLLLGLGATCAGALSPSLRASDPTAVDALAALERRHGGRLGVDALDTETGRRLGWRADERFALCSTFKLLLAALVLHEHGAGRLDGDAPITFSEADLVPHAPVIGERLKGGVTALSALELARATQQTSDNVAANLLIQRLGGPAAVTAGFRAMGDTVTRLDRIEPEMNRVPPGDPRDTTTPRAIADTTARLLTGHLLDAASRDRLALWMVDTTTGLRRLRAGLPESWRAGDKTGTALIEGLGDQYNDVAVAWPPGRSPIVIAAYYATGRHHPTIRPEDEAVLAEVGRIVAARFAG